jgi:hypothetical protein
MVLTKLQERYFNFLCNNPSLKDNNEFKEILKKRVEKLSDNDIMQTINLCYKNSHPIVILKIKKEFGEIIE